MIVDQNVPSTALRLESQRLLAEQPATRLRPASLSLLTRIGPPRSFCFQKSGRGLPAGGMPSGAPPPPIVLFPQAPSCSPLGLRIRTLAVPWTKTLRTYPRLVR
jgi:hypothetical protein